MTIRVEIPSEIQAELALQARARGMDVPTYAATLLKDAVQPERASDKRSLEDFKETSQTLGEF